MTVLPLIKGQSKHKPKKIDTLKVQLLTADMRIQHLGFFHTKTGINMER